MDRKQRWKSRGSEKPKGERLSARAMQSEDGDRNPRTCPPARETEQEPSALFVFLARKLRAGDPEVQVCIGKAKCIESGLVRTKIVPGRLFRKLVLDGQAERKNAGKKHVLTTESWGVMKEINEGKTGRAEEQLKGSV
ncbi:hypothetical protein K438DRAFT_1764832 [Mycena galopus ATCC 62051]|nr:hypothetical protein K438DRAFT_1764832 [Mycena galopus ATCC 62051]